MTQLSFSQQRYPRKIVLDSDTVVVITPHQLSVTNGIIEERNELLNYIPQLEVLTDVQDSLISSLRAQTSLYRKLREEDDKSIQMLQESLKLTKKTKNRNMVKIGGISLGVGVLFGLLIGK